MKHIDKYPGMDWKCTAKTGDVVCGKEAMVHTTKDVDEETCIHLYFCNDCWWVYSNTPRKMTLKEVADKQKDIDEWKKRYGYS